MIDESDQCFFIKNAYIRVILDNPLFSQTFLSAHAEVPMLEYSRAICHRSCTVGNVKVHALKGLRDAEIFPKRTCNIK